jgi:RNA polymerase subunit RPABC4/transcription elongation factor Spt4
MSELTNCKFCKQTVAINAQTCPHCGGIDPVEHKKIPWSILVVLIILAVSIKACWSAN